MTQSVIEKAQELALLIAQSPEFISMRAAEDAAAQDEAIAEAFGRYNDLHQEMERLSMQQEPDFDRMGALSKEMEEVQKEIQALPLAQAMQNARQGFTDLMQAVNMELSKVLAPQGSCGDDCGGDCHSCGGGCSHCH